MNPSQQPPQPALIRAQALRNILSAFPFRDQDTPDLGPAFSSPWTGIPSSTLSTPPDSPPEFVGMSDSPEQKDLGSPGGSITGTRPWALR
ncbi:hypothetical protein FRC11_004935, partial [Ceratobasidium sp. 423]